MTTIRIEEEPTFTELFDPVEKFTLDAQSAFVSGTSEEERSSHVDGLRGRSTDVRFVDILGQDASTFSFKTPDAGITTLPLRSRHELCQFWRQIEADTTFLDITGLAHHVWAPLVASALVEDIELRVVYVEPTRYRFSPIRTEGELFDLSEGFRGMSPLPGFASLQEPEEEDTALIPLLGFEGQRFSYVLEQVQPPREHIFPVVGVPGFRPEFVFFAYHGNRLPLERTDAWKETRFATANCPFSLFYLLDQLARDNPTLFLKIAPIGTKPHGLGAILFALANPDRVEIVYDHPQRRPARTEGTARLLVYHLAGLRSRVRLSG